MGTGYTRNDTANNIADGNVINASDLDGEFDAVQAAFNGTTGHSHDGTSGEGPQIDTAGIADSAVTTAKINDLNVTTGKIANDAVTLGTKTSGNYVATGAVSGVGLSGSASAEGATFTVTSNATDANTASTIVARDASGNFSAGTITASLTGTASNANQLDSLDSTQFLRSDVADTKTGADLGFADNVKATFGAGADLQIYHDATGGIAGSIGSYIQDAGTGNLYIRGTSLVLEDNSGNDFIAMNDTGTGGTVTLKHNAVAKLATASTGITVTGELTADTVDATTLQIGNTSITATAAELNYNDITALGQVQASKTVTADGNGWVNFGDNEKIRFGASNDLEIYHDSLHSYIKDTGTGNLRIPAANFNVRSANDLDSQITAVSGAGVSLYYNASKKFETLTGGVDITGNITVSGTVDGRDVATDGTKLDGIESGATADQSASEILTLIKTVDGAGSGLDADTLDGISSASFLRSDAADTKTSGSLNFSDNVTCTFGAGSDLSIFHDGVGNGSYINESGTGNLFITGTNILLKNTGSTATYASFTNAGAVALYYNGGIKLATVSDGISVTGNVQSSTGYFEGASPNDRVQVNASSIDFYIDASNEFRMESDGDFHADGDVIAFSTTVSDERLKTDIEKIENATDKVNQLNGYTFTYKADGKKSAGVIAQEVEKVLPSAVSEKELPLKMDDGVAYKTVQYDQIIGLLIESIKELKQEINDLKGV